MKKPPSLATRFLRWYCHPELLDEVEGDLYELFQRRVETKGLWQAKVIYWLNVLMFLHPDYIRKRRYHPTNYTTMLRHNFLLAFRNFQRYKSTFFINLIGLSSGIAIALLIYLWVQDERSMDRFHANDDRLYQAMVNRQNTDGITTERATPVLLAPSLAAELPEVAFAVATTSGIDMPSFTLTADNKTIKADGQFVGEDFFQLFSYDLIQGDPSQVLGDKKSIVISEELALRLFNTTENIIGRAVEWGLVGITQQARVTGMMKKVPSSSTDQFDMLLSFEIYKELMGSAANDWGATAPSTFLLLPENTNISDFQEKVAGFIKNKVPTANTEVFLRPYADRYLYNRFENGRVAGGRIEYVRLFSIAALFIMVIACVNFMNLFTARASRRVKEIGVKKAIGANRNILITQFLGEALLLTFISLLTAIVLVWLLLPQFNELTGKQLSFLLDQKLILTAFGVACLIGLLAGSYPAIYLSSFDPVKVLKGKLHTSVGELWTRRGLVVFQFTISVMLIVAVVIVYLQMDYVQDKNLGYDQNQVIYFEAEGKIKENLETFLSETKNLPGIVNASSSTHIFAGHQSKTSGLNWEGKNPDDIISFEVVTANYDLLETLDIELQEGRSFSRNFSTDSATLILNKAAIDVMGWQEPVGKVISWGGEEREIIGVTNNFHFQSLHQEVTPLLFVLAPEETHKVMVKLVAGEEQAAIAQLDAFYKQYNPDFVLDYQFMDETYQSLYLAEQRVSTLSQYFAGIAIIISCLGLFGLAAFTAERRRKEIGIRKALGASSFSIVRRLSGDFTRMVLVAIFIALPISYFVAQRWLQDFAFSIDLEWWYFAGAGLVALLVAWFTVGLQTVKAARVNPVECLKDE